MNQKLKLLKLECTACFRQLSESFHCSNLEAVILTAFLLVMSGALAFFNSSGELTGLLFAAAALLSAVIGFAVIQKKNIHDLLAGKQFRSYQALPVETGTLALLKTEKYLIGSLLTFTLVNAYLHVLLVLGGISFIRSLLSFLICTLLFSICQNIRMHFLHVRDLPKRIMQLLLATAVILCICFRDRLSPGNLPDLCFLLADTYRNYMSRLLLVLCPLAVFVKAVSRPSLPQSLQEEEADPGIPEYMTPVLARMNFVLRKDLSDLLHTRRKRRSFMFRLCSAVLIPVLLSLSARTGILPLNNASMFFPMICASITPIGFAGLFETQMTMGYEGKMILYYILSGSSVSQIQTARVRSLSVFSSVLSAISAVLSGILLNCPVLMVLQIAALNSLFAVLLLHINGYYCLKKTKYLNDMSAPDMTSHLIAQITTTVAEFLLFIPAVFTDSAFLLNHAFTAFMVCMIMLILLTVLFSRRLRKGDRYFYGEYQEAV